MRNYRKQSGFTLIELLIVVAIIGIIAAIAIPNLLNAIDRGKQKRTMADIRSVGTAVESYAVDVNFYPRGFALGPVATTAEPHVAPSPGASTGQTSCGGAPETVTFLRLSCAKNPTYRLSGDQNGSEASSVPARNSPRPVSIDHIHS